jgi:phage-related protein
MDTFTYTPTWTTRGILKPRVLTAQYGDGYRQDAADGINNILEVWQLVFNPVGLTEAQAIADFVRNEAGYKKFNWTPPTPSATPRVYICQNIDWTHTGGATMSLNVEFIEVPPV